MAAWPVLSRSLQLFPEDIRVIERGCRAIRFAIRCLETHFAPLVDPLARQIVELYHRQPHSTFLYLGSILVDEFGTRPECLDFLMAMLAEFLPRTFQLLQGEENGCTHHPDTVDDFFRLNARYLQRAPLPYLKSQHLKSILECGLVACKLQQKEANASVMKFFFDLLHLERSKDEKPDFEERRRIVAGIRSEWLGMALTEALVRASVYDLPSYALHDVGDVLFEMMTLDRVSVCKWLEQTLKGFESDPNAANVVNRKQLVHFHNEATKAEEPRHVADAVRQFSRLWR